MEASMVNRSLLWLIAAFALTACSDRNTVGDSGTGTDSAANVDAASGPDGTPDLGGSQQDTGATKQDTGPGPGCGSEFTAKNACGGSVVGTWKYQRGCVEPSAFVEMKKSCAGLAIKDVKFAIDPQFNTLILTGGGKLTRAIKGTISGTGIWPQSCAKLGCKVLEGVIKLLAPLVTVSCKGASASSCQCSISLPVAHVGAGTYTIKGGVLTATVGGSNHPYNFCVKGKGLRYRGTLQNTNDQHVTYLLER